jgi:ribosomal protein S27AE
MVSVARGVAAQHRGEQPPDFMKMTTEDALEQEMELAPDSMEMTTEDGVEQDMKMVLDSITSLEAEKVVPVASLELAPESVEMVPDSLPPGAFVCGRCHLVHEDREAWNHAHSRFYPCPRCGLVHADYSIDAMLGRIKVDCELFIEQYKGLLPGKDDDKASVRRL